MSADLRARFMPRFVEVARARLEKMSALLADPAKTGQVAVELHTVAGEAAMLGLTELADTARSAEIAAHHGDTSAARRGVQALGQQVESLAAGLPARSA